MGGERRTVASEPLTAAFVRMLGDRMDLATAPYAEVSSALSTLVEEARRAWPDFGIPPQEFVERIAEVLWTTDGLAATLQKLHTADLYLALACLRGMPEATKQLERRMLPSVAEIAALLRAPKDLAEEARQRLCVSMLTSDGGAPLGLSRYNGRAPLAAWLRAAVLRTANRMQRDERRFERLCSGHYKTHLVQNDFEALQLKTMYQPEFAAAFRDAFASLHEHEQALLRLAYMQGLSIDALGRCYSVHRATAARWVSRARDRLVARTKARLGRSLALRPSEVDSLIRMLASQLTAPEDL